MDHSEYFVDILDSQGAVIGQKRRRDVDKQIDRYHGVHVMLRTPSGGIIVSDIPERFDLPNLYAHRFGSTVATIRRFRETAEAAGRRALRSDLLLRHPPVLHLLCEGFFDLSDGREIYLSSFHAEHDVPSEYDVEAITSLSVMLPDHLDRLIESNPERVAPTFEAIWRRYRHRPGL